MAVGHANMRFLTVKTVEQQNLQAMHRIRPAAVWTRRCSRSGRLQPGHVGRVVVSTRREKRSWGEGDLERHTRFRFLHLVPLSVETDDLAGSWVCSRKRPAVPSTSSM